MRFKSILRRSEILPLPPLLGHVVLMAVVPSPLPHKFRHTHCPPHCSGWLVEQAVRRGNAPCTAMPTKQCVRSLCAVCFCCLWYKMCGGASKFSLMLQQSHVTVTVGVSAACGFYAAFFFLVILELWYNWLVCTSCMASSAGAAEVAIHTPFVFVMTAWLKTLALGWLCLYSHFSSLLLASATTANPTRIFVSSCPGESCGGIRHIVSHFRQCVAL